MKKWFGRFVKIMFFLVAFLAVILTVLVNMGGDSGTLERAIEDYATRATGFETRIDTFKKMTFFPYISVDAGDIRMKRIDQEALKSWAELQQLLPEEERGNVPPPMPFLDDRALPDITVEKFVVSLGFWDLAVRSKKVHDLQIYNAVLKPGSLLQKRMVIDMLAIDETPEGKPFLNFKGQLGEDEFVATVDLDSFGEGKSTQYALGEESVFEADIGTLHIEGVVRPRKKGGFHLRDVKISYQEEEVLQAVFSFVPTSDKKLSFNGEFTVVENGSTGKIDWVFDLSAESENLITGAVTGQTLYEADFSEGSKLKMSWQAWDELFKKWQAKEKPPVKTDITVKADSFVPQTGEEIAPYEGKLVIDDHTFSFVQEKTAQ